MTWDQHPRYQPTRWSIMMAEYLSRELPAPRPEDALTFDEAEARGLDGSLRDR